jgi:hypothetical protein
MIPSLLMISETAAEAIAAAMANGAHAFKAPQASDIQPVVSGGVASQRAVAVLNASSAVLGDRDARVVRSACSRFGCEGETISVNENPGADVVITVHPRTPLDDAHLALAAADVGMAMGTGTDVAMHAAGVTLMRGDLGLVAAALDISHHTVIKIRQNLFWAFAYNVAGIPLAALGYLNPVVAGAAMALSSVSVMANALLLKRWRPSASR